MVVLERGVIGSTDNGGRKEARIVGLTNTSFLFFFSRMRVRSGGLFKREGVLALSASELKGIIHIVF